MDSGRIGSEDEASATLIGAIAIPLIAPEWVAAGFGPTAVPDDAACGVNLPVAAMALRRLLSRVAAGGPCGSS